MLEVSKQFATFASIMHCDRRKIGDSGVASDGTIHTALNPCNHSFLCIAFAIETFVLGMGHYKLILTVRGKSSITKDLEPLKIKSPLHTKKPSRSFL